MIRRTYLDTSVLIEAARGKGPKAEVALSILDDHERVFLSCPFLDFELLPQAILNKSHKEQRFLETYLAHTERTEDLDAILRSAFQEASRSAVSGIDALHVAAAHLLQADEFITTEKPDRPIYKNGLVPVIYCDRESATTSSSSQTAESS